MQMVSQHGLSTYTQLTTQHGLSTYTMLTSQHGLSTYTQLTSQHGQCTHSVQHYTDLIKEMDFWQIIIHFKIKMPLRGIDNQHQ